MSTADNQIPLVETSIVPVEFISIGVDWLTAVASTQSARFLLLHEAEKRLRLEASLGNVVQPWGMAGYRGWISGGLQFGDREDSSIVRLSSDLAAEAWWEFYQMAESITRIDVQATVRLDHDPGDEVLRQYARAKRWWLKHRHTSMPELRANPKRGNTLYVGARQSALYGRLYNKAYESKDPYFERCLRAEVEIKGGVCRSTMDHLISEGALQNRIVSSLLTFFNDRGCKLQGWPDDSRLPLGRRSMFATSAQKRLRWLQVGVRPSVQWLISLGFQPQVYDALGLPAMVQIGLDFDGPTCADTIQ